MVTARDPSLEATVPAIIDNMSRGWNRDPAGVALGAPRTGMSAAIWSHNVDDVQEVAAEPDPERHIVSVMRSGNYSAEVHQDGRHVFSKTLQSGGVQVMAAGVRPRAIHRGRWSIMHLYLPAALVTGLALDEGLVASPGALELIDPQCVPCSAVAQIGAQVAAEMAAGAPLSRLRIDTLGVELAIRMIREWSNLRVRPAGKRSQSLSGLAPWQVTRTADLMASDLAADLPLQLVASQIGLSAYHFSRAFKASTGVPPHRYLVQLRIEKTRELLETTDLPISEIASQVGYDDPSYLARLFRREVGVTPLAYRQARRR